MAGPAFDDCRAAALAAAGAKLSGRQNLAAFDFPNGSLVLTEAGTKRRAALHVVAGDEGLASIDPGGIDVFASDLAEFRAALTAENRTLKRALTDPRLLSGIGNAYSDEILHKAQMSPVTLTHKLKRGRVGEAFRRDAGDAQAVDRAAARRRRRWLSGEGDCVSRGYGRARAVWAALPEMRGKDLSGFATRTTRRITARDARRAGRFSRIAACRGCWARIGRGRSRSSRLSPAASNNECLRYDRTAISADSKEKWRAHEDDFELFWPISFHACLDWLPFWTKPIARSGAEMALLGLSDYSAADRAFHRTHLPVISANIRWRTWRVPCRPSTDKSTAG